MQSAQGAKSMIASLREQINTGDLCDVLFYNKTGSVWAHSCVLAAFSPILSQMISLRLNNGNHWSIRQPMQISIHQLTMSEPESESDCLLCLSQVITYIYTGTIDVDNCHKEHVHALSEHFQNCELLAVFERWGGYKKPLRCNEVNVNLEKESINNCIDLNSSGKDCEPLPGEKEEPKIQSTNSIVSDVVAKEAATNEDNVSDNTACDKSKTIICDKCHYVSHDLQLIDVHSKIFHNSNYYKCLNCKFQNRNLNNLAQHIVESCNFKDNLICSICLFKSISISELLSHVQSHRATEPFECGVCQRRFEKRSLWLKHVVSHFPEHTFSCKKCELSFRTDCHRTDHCGPESQHRSRKHVCLECGFVASYNYVLEKHKLKHRKTRYQCDQNDCLFYTSSEAMLVRHKAIHRSKKKPIKDAECPDCKMKFTLLKNLKRHMKIHVEESTKIKCSICNYETLRKDKLREHFMVKHDSELRDDVESKIKRLGESVDISEPVQREIILGPNGSHVQTGRVDSEKPPEVEREQTEPEKENIKTPSNHNTLLMDSKGDISIVNSDKNNSVTLRNIGNLTGSITLDEKTGILTMNNINSGSVFLNETTGELTYVNLEPQKETENSNSAAVGQNESDNNDVTFEITKLDEFTGEIIRVVLPPEVEETNSTEQENEPCDMDLVNDDSLDGFDDFDELLFDVFNGEESTTNYYNRANDVMQNGVPLAVPRLDESTGLLTFDNGYQQQEMSWNNEYSNDHSSRMDEEQAYQLLLDEATGVLHI